MPILDVSDDGDFYPEDEHMNSITEADYNFQDPDARWQDSRDTFGGETDAYPSELDRQCD